MIADYSVELGRDDPALELPWRSPDGTWRFHDLKSDLSSIDSIVEAVEFPELRGVLLRLNAADFPLQTAKCDVWKTCEMSPEEEIFDAEWKQGSYIDLLFSSDDKRFDFPLHEQFAITICRLLSRAPDISAAAEFFIRRCHYWNTAPVRSMPPDAIPHAEPLDTKPGFYFSVYVAGFGNTDSDARRQWAIACELVKNAIVQCADKIRRHTNLLP
jgi:hypothetical protein